MNSTATDDGSWFEELKAKSNATDTALYENCIRECGRCSWCGAIGMPCEFLGEHNPAVWRQLVHERATNALEELGVDKPFTRWREAVAFIHNAEKKSIEESKPIFKEIALYIMIGIVWASRAPEDRKDVPVLEDIEEAKYALEHAHDSA